MPKRDLGQDPPADAGSRNPALVERGEHTRAALLEAAVTLIAADGWAGLTTRRVATQANVNPALVHYHFGSVAALGRLAASKAMNIVSIPALSRLLNTEDLLEGIEGAFAATIALEPADAEPRVVLEASIQALRDPTLGVQLRETLRGFRAVLERRIVAAQRAGQIADGVDAGGVAVLLAAALDGIGLHRLLDTRAELAAMAPALRALLEAPHD